MEKTFKIISENGLHARPATVLVNEAVNFNSDLVIESKGKQANLKSIMGVMSLGVYNNEEIKIIAQGADEEEAMEKIKEIIVSQNLGKEI